MECNLLHSSSQQIAVRTLFQTLRSPLTHDDLSTQGAALDTPKLAFRPGVVGSLFEHGSGGLVPV